MSPPARTRRQLVRLVATALFAAAASTTALGPSAGAAPIDDKKKQAAALQDQIEAADLQIGALAEQLHVAETARDAAQQTVADAQAQIDRAKAEVNRILDIVRGNLASLYRRTLTGTSLTGMDFDEASDLVKRGRYVEAQSERDDDLLTELAVAQDDLSVQREEAGEARDTAAAQSEEIKAATAAYESARAEQQRLLDGITGEIAAALEAEQARRAAEAAAKYAAPVFYPNVGPPNGSASQAIAYAQQVIGSGYSKNPRMGPTYDCSGLTYMAWQAAGVDIPTVSNTQYSGLTQIPLAAIQPGDLIFWGPGGSAHVALYIGGGQIIDASSSQGQVTQRAIWGSPEPVAARVI